MARSKNDGGAAEVAEKLADEQEQGFRGAAVDPTPNHAYTVAGVTAGEPTPETDADLAKSAREATRVTETKFDRGAETMPAADVDAETKLTGDDLDAAVKKHSIDTSSGGSNADGSMNADEKRAAVAKAEAEASGNGS